MESRNDFQKGKPPFFLGKEILGLPQGRKMSVQEGQVPSKVTPHLNEP